MSSRCLSSLSLVQAFRSSVLSSALFSRPFNRLGSWLSPSMASFIWHKSSLIKQCFSFLRFYNARQYKNIITKILHTLAPVFLCNSLQKIFYKIGIALWKIRLLNRNVIDNFLTLHYVYYCIKLRRFRKVPLNLANVNVMYHEDHLKCVNLISSSSTFSSSTCSRRLLRSLSASTFSAITYRSNFRFSTKVLYPTFVGSWDYVYGLLTNACSRKIAP